SRRRHTRCLSDWSSDVCSSDLRFHERFISTRPEDRHFDNRAYHDAATEYLGKLPDDQFRDAARNAVAQAPPQEKAGLLGAILSEIGRASCRERVYGESSKSRVK